MGGDKYIQTLQKTPTVNTRTHHAKTVLVTNSTIEKIINFSAVPLSRRFVGNWLPRIPLTMW